MVTSGADFQIKNVDSVLGSSSKRLTHKSTYGGEYLSLLICYIEITVTSRLLHASSWKRCCLVLRSLGGLINDGLYVWNSTFEEAMVTSGHTICSLDAAQQSGPQALDLRLPSRVMGAECLILDGKWRP